MGERGFFRRRGLILPAVLAPMAETALVLVVGPRDGAGLAPQVTAIPPLDVFHDLRWVSVYHNSWIVLALELVAILVLRSLWVAWMVQRAWPRGDLPPMFTSLRRVTLYYAVGMVLFVPWVVLLFGLAFSHLSFLFFAALPPALALALALHQGAAGQAVRSSWRPTLRGVGWVLASFGWLTVAGGITATAPPGVAIVVAGLAGLANARAWYGLVRALAREPERRRLPALAPALAGAVVLVVVGGSALGFTVTMGNDGGMQSVMVAPPEGPGSHPVLIAAGLYSRFDPRPPLRLPDGYVGWRFSYRGIDGRGAPLRYGPEDTQQSLLRSARKMGEQVDALWRAYGEPVTIVAESEGAVVARLYLIEVYQPETGRVDRLITLNMPDAVTTVSFPELGRQGWGVASGWGLRGLAAVLEGISPLELSVDSPLAHSYLNCRLLLSRVASSPPPPGVQEVSFYALADWVDPPAAVDGTQAFIVMAAHGGLVGRPGVQELILEILAGDPDVPGTSPARQFLARLVSAGSQPWQVPGLAVDTTAGSLCSE